MKVLAHKKSLKIWSALAATLLWTALHGCSSSEVNDGELSEGEETSDEIKTADTLPTDGSGDPLATTTTSTEDPTAAPSSDPGQDLAGAFGDPMTSAPVVEEPKPARKLSHSKSKKHKAPSHDLASVGMTQNNDSQPPPLDPPPVMPEAQPYTPPPVFSPQANLAQNNYTAPVGGMESAEPKTMLGNLSKNKVVGAGVLLLAAGGFMLFRRKFSSPKY